MRSKVSVFLTVGTLFLLQMPLPARSVAAEARQITRQEENRWVPSLSISGGALIQPQKGSVDSVLFENGSPTPVPLQGMVDGDDLVVSPFVGTGLELMSPALPIPTRPRFFLGAEILPTFASEREVATQGDPGCIRGPEIDAPCVADLTEPPQQTFAEESAQGEGSNTITLTDTLTYGASFGVAFPANIGRRQLRIKSSLGWLHYKIDGSGVVANAMCALDASTMNIPNDTACTPRTTGIPDQVIHGFVRETQLEGSGSQSFNAIGGGLDLEMDTVRYGPVGASLFLGGGFYRTLGDRTIGFSDSETFMDELGNDTAAAEWEIEVEKWMYRAHVGIRFQWLGFPE
jgi:hypothetical protein